VHMINCNDHKLNSYYWFGFLHCDVAVNDV